MYFNRKNTEQKNWRMVKKGKHFLFGCSLVLTVGAVMASSSVKADETTEATTVSTVSNEEDATSTSGTNSSTYSAPAETVLRPLRNQLQLLLQLWNQVLQLKKKLILFKHQA